jgi:hypothetical protein
VITTRRPLNRRKLQRVKVNGHNIVTVCMHAVNPDRLLSIRRSATGSSRRRASHEPLIWVLPRRLLLCGRRSLLFLAALLVLVMQKRALVTELALT